MESLRGNWRKGSIRRWEDVWWRLDLITSYHTGDSNWWALQRINSGFYASMGRLSQGGQRTKSPGWREGLIISGGTRQKLVFICTPSFVSIPVLLFLASSVSQPLSDEAFLSILSPFFAVSAWTAWQPVKPSALCPQSCVSFFFFSFILWILLTRLMKWTSGRYKLLFSIGLAGRTEGQSCLWTDEQIFLGFSHISPESLTGSADRLRIHKRRVC